MCQVILNAPVYAKLKNQLYMPKGKSLNCRVFIKAEILLFMHAGFHIIYF